MQHQNNAALLLNHNPGAASPWEEHKCIYAIDSLQFGPNTYDNSKAMVRAYINGDHRALISMVGGGVNPDVLWCLPGSAIMYPTITHALMAVQFTEGCPESHPSMTHVYEIADMIRLLLKIGARREVLDTTGNSAWHYETHFKVHSLIRDAFRGRTPGQPADGGCCTVQ